MLRSVRSGRGRYSTPDLPEIEAAVLHEREDPRLVVYMGRRCYLEVKALY